MQRICKFLLIGTLVCKIGFCQLTISPKIAVIGGGIGGAVTSHYLTELFEGRLNIDLFEAEKLGGRLATVKIAGDEYEAGGAVIHDRNLLMKKFIKLLGMEERPSCGDLKFGIWNKDEFVFKESSYNAWTLAKLIYRYGLQPFRLHSYINSVMDDFGKIYQLHDEGIAFANVTGLLSAMNSDFPKMLQISVKNHLTGLGYSSQLINELVEATLVVNYNQGTDIHSFVGCVSIAGAGANLWSVKGGNKEVPRHLIHRNGKVNVMSSIVKKIVHLQGHNNIPQYELQYNNNGSSDTMKSIYDIVIVATPLTKDHEMATKFFEFPEKANLEFPGTYQSTIATFVHGVLNPEYFNLEDSIGAVLSCDPNKTIINSVGNLVSVHGNCSSVWKIFTSDYLDETIIEKMFTKIEKIDAIKWKAYPKYTETKPRLDFKLYDSLYYVNAIEWAASAMEMSAIGGRNVAILAYNDFKNRYSRKNSFDEEKASNVDEILRHKDL